MRGKARILAIVGVAVGVIVAAGVATSGRVDAKDAVTRPAAGGHQKTTAAEARADLATANRKGVASPADPYGQSSAEDPDAAATPGAIRVRTLPLAEREGLQPLLPAPVPGWTMTAHTVNWGGLTRYYVEARPDNVPAGAHLPVLVMLHGHGMLPASIEPATHFLQTVGQAVVVYPAGYFASWDAGYCCGVAAHTGTDDVGFLKAVVARVLAADPSLERNRVYLAGYSNGGRMAYRMACQDPGAFAGVAAVEAVPVYYCPSTRPVPLMVIASTNDPLVTVYNSAPPKHIDGYTEITVTNAVAQWRQLDGCRAAPVTSRAGLFSFQTWDHCAGGARVELAVLTGGSHAWPQGGPGTPSAEHLIWNFFTGSGTRAG